MKIDSYDFTGNANSGIKPNLNYLIVDDFQPMRRTVNDQLTRAGVKKIRQAVNGQEALQIISKHKVDVIICDWNMPNVSGFDVLKRVKGDANLSHVHFMFVTAEADRDSVRMAIQAGVDQFLVKPFTPKTLREKIEDMLSRPPRGTQSGSGEEVVSGEKPKEVVSPGRKAKKSDRSTVLVVDDVPTNIDVIKGILSDSYKIKAATSGEKALAMIQRDKPDLILLDIMMPEMDGYQVCDELKADLETEHIPVIFLTAKSEITDMTRGFDLGAVDYITKPANPELLKARVKNHLQLKHSRDELSDEIENLMEVAQLREDVERITRHDLKNPLSAIINTSEQLLESQYLGMEQRSDIEMIRDSSFDVLEMINRSLDLYKMETGSYKLKAESLDLVKIVQKVVNDSRVNARDRKITVKFEAPEICIFLGEELLTMSMLGNLIKNAIEASAEQEVVTVAVSYDDDALISIHNNGVIPPEMRDNFFEKYATVGKEQGTGLGTYSAKLIAKTQKGDISFTTDNEDGTRLTVSLPIDPSFKNLA